MPDKISRKERIEGAILGLLIGDALGVPYEFNAPEQIPEPAKIEFTPPAGFKRSHEGVKPGTWSDDGAQALSLLASLLNCGKFDPDDFGRRLVQWYDHGYLAVDNNVFDIGITTASAIQNIRFGVPPVEAGPNGVHDNGNGSLMRVLPLAIWHQGSDEELVRDASLQSSITHGHIRSQICCAIYSLWARNILFEIENPWDAAVSSLRAMYSAESEFIQEMEYYIRPDEYPNGKGSGYVVDSLRSAKMVQTQGEYEKIVKASISLGNDTDTTACIAGGIAGLQYGIQGIPKRWVTKLRGKKLYRPLLDELIRYLE